MDDIDREDPSPELAAWREPDMQRLAGGPVASAQARGVELTGEGGLLTALTKQILQSEVS